MLVMVMIFFLTWPAMAFGSFNNAGFTERHSTSLKEISNYILEYHISKPQADDLVDGAIDGMLDTLNDPYAEHITPESWQEFADFLDSKYVGIGIKMEAFNDYIQVVVVFANSPAKQALIKEGDLIIAVDGKSIKQLSLDIIAEKIRGVEGSTVVLTIRRDNQTFKIPLVRAPINTPTVYSEVVFENIGYIDIISFNERTANEFLDAWQNLQKQNRELKGLILDLRNDPGGHLIAAVDIVDYFLPLNKKIISFIENCGEETIYFSNHVKLINNLSIVVLVDENTASAAEIVAGALQDHGVATLVGNQTYGKGTVQTILNLSDGGALKLTVAEYRLPDGRLIQNTGLIPDRQVLSPGLKMHVAKSILKPAEYQRIRFTIGKNIANINGAEIKMRGGAYYEDGSYYIPLRFTMEALGYMVNWDQKSSRIELTKEQENYHMFIPIAANATDIVVSEGITYISIPGFIDTGLPYNIRIKPNLIIVE